MNMRQTYYAPETEVLVVRFEGNFLTSTEEGSIESLDWDV